MEWRCSSGISLGLQGPVKGALIASPFQDTFMPPTVCEQLGDGSFLFNSAR